MAKYQFRNMKQLKNGIDVQIKNILNNLTNDVYNELYNNVKENIYEWQPSKYSRTMQVLESISKTKILHTGSGYKVYIYFDVDKIVPEYRMPNEWNAHASFDNSEVDGNDLLGWLEYGTDSMFYSHSESKFYRDTLEWLYYEFNTMVKTKLIKCGFKI